MEAAAKCNSELNDCSTICELGIVLEAISSLFVKLFECSFKFGCQPFDYVRLLKTVFLFGYSLTYGHSLLGIFYWFQHQFILFLIKIINLLYRMMSIKLVIGGSTLNIVSAYAPYVGLHEEEKKSFWEAFDEMVKGVPNNKKLFIRGDSNGHIKSSPRSYDDVHGGFVFGERNEGGTTLLDFARALGLIVAN